MLLVLLINNALFQIFDLLFFRSSVDYSVQICLGVVQSVLASYKLGTGDGEDPRCSTPGHRPQLCQPQPAPSTVDTVTGAHIC